jgi:hypothetical protein
MNKFAAGDGMNLYSLLHSLDDDTLRSMSPVLDLEQFRQLLTRLAGLDAEELRAIASADPELAKFSELADLVDDGHNAANTVMAEIRAYTDRLRVESCIAELEPALKAKFLRFNDRIQLGEGTDAEVQAFIQQLKRYLQDPNWFVVHWSARSGSSLVRRTSGGRMSVVSALGSGSTEDSDRRTSPLPNDDEEDGSTDSNPSDDGFPYNNENTLPNFPYKDESTGAQILGSPHFIQVGGWGNPTLAAAAAVLADLYADNIPAAAAAGAAAELAQRYKHLSDREVALFDLLGRLAQGGSIYKVWIAEDDLWAAMDSELDIEDRRRLLANMKSRGILEEGAGKWRAVW